MATIGRRSITALLSVMSVKWKNSGLVKIEGIPAPSGSYEVGCTHLMHQDLQIRLYYPTERDLSTTFEYAKYFPHPKYINALLDVIAIPLSSLASGIVRIFCTPRIPALLNAPLIQNNSMQSLQNNSDNVDAQDPPKGFPVVVFSHGLGSHFHHYSGICSDLASHGYVVAAVEHRDGSASLVLKRVPGPKVKEGQYDQYVDKWIPYNKFMLLNDKKIKHTNFSLRNKQVRQRAKEMGQVLDILHLLNEGGDVHDMLGGQFDFTQFKGRLNMELAAVCGHSFGGSTVVQTLSEDPRFKCGIALDTWMFPLDEDIYTHGIHQPLTFINSFDFQWANNIACMMKLVKPASESETSSCTLYTLKGTTHLSQSDAPFTIPLTALFTFTVPRALKEFELKNSSLNKYVAHEVNMKICHAFLNRFLIQDKYSEDIVILDGGEGASEYILYGTNVDWEKEKNTRRETVSNDLITSSKTLESRA